MRIARDGRMHARFRSHDVFPFGASVNVAKGSCFLNLVAARVTALTPWPRQRWAARQFARQLGRRGHTEPFTSSDVLCVADAGLRQVRPSGEFGAHAAVVHVTRSLECKAESE